MAAIRVKDGHYAGRTGRLLWQDGTRMSVWLQCPRCEGATASHNWRQCQRGCAGGMAVVIPAKLVELTDTNTASMASARAMVLTAHHSS